MKRLLAIVLTLVIILGTISAIASEVNVAVVDVLDPVNSVSIEQGQSSPITINISVTGKQEGTATFKVYRDWKLSNGTFKGYNEQEFTVFPQDPKGKDPVIQTFYTTGTVSVDSTQSASTFELIVGAFGITNDNKEGAKLANGRESSYSVTVTAPPTPVDKTAPTLTYTLNPADPNGSNGWYTNVVEVSFDAEDNEGGSGIKEGSIPTNYTLTEDGIYESEKFTVEDNAGNIGEVTVPKIKIDKTDPEITVPPNNQVFILNSTDIPDWYATDETSGIASAKITGFDTSTVGTRSYTITAIDEAGNSETLTKTYKVEYNFGGILDPVSKGKTFKAGSTVPVKFQLTDANGAFISNAEAKIGYAKLTNNVFGDDVGAISTTAATTGNLFRYDSKDNLYIFNLSTKGLSSGTYRITITLDDDSTQQVVIGLK